MSQSRFGFGRLTRPYENKKSVKVQIRDHIDNYRRSLYSEWGELGEEEIEKMVDEEEDRIKRALNKHKARAAAVADEPRRKARASLFSELGPERAAEVLYVAAEPNLEDPYFNWEDEDF